MKKMICAAALLALAGTASADQVATLHQIAHYNIGTPVSNPSDVVDPTALYSNVTTFSGNVLVNGGAGTTTRSNGDDIHMTAASSNIDGFTFSVYNGNTAALSVRARVRFFDTTGAAGGPGTYITGFSFNPFVFSNGVTIIGTGPGGVAGFALPQNFWATLQFDNVGATATLAQTNNFGQGIFAPTDVGSSANNAWFGTQTISIAGVNNPTGSQGTIVGAAYSSFGWEFTDSTFVPAPGATALLGLAGLTGLRRRR